MKLRRRHVQLLVSSVGTLLILPWGVFLGAMFTFAFRSDESLWAWAFDIISFWFQIPAILLSFFKPRLASWWMIANVAVSISMGVIFEVRNSYSPGARHLSAVEWLADLLMLWKNILAFWGLPTLVAVLLVIVTGRQKRVKPV